ncbi:MULTISPECIES: DUF4234 domain-containing protein [Pectobacterium]|uniref:DUF4234 domain-containing protein n=1 Tax=Pectobacterium TaxID=122277 RepID=UPI0005E08C9F|nr:DUF4234 domain-containing protein [Pectobacterium parmentieri]OVZ97124.1 hypothetical protein CBW53_11505 [Yersinia frederiksenii]MBI0552108.1 DUF4234 domain-containing protein [Pectobacterium parmentieri]MBI0561194.1 DUF4234 domain-containing protein [Pectobacterium parmentieri]MBI0565399.1 DUF4234 domain-containing protein [Pectobacterium parmentieri]CNJ28728.1 Uncharacterised protein [Yersinia frederiksenii]
MMNDINLLKNKIDTKVTKFVLLSVVTGGIYPMMWLFLNQSKLTEEMKNEFVAKDYPLWLAIVTGFGWLLIDVSYAVSDTETILDHIATLLSVASAVMLIVWAFKAKSALQAYALNEFKFELKMNPFYTFIFSIYYIVYCINDMESELQKHNIIHSKQHS